VGETIPLDLMPASKGRVGITPPFPIGPLARATPAHSPPDLAGPHELRGIPPFTAPLTLGAHRVAPAIASGNPIVLKPPSKDPLVMLTVAEIIEEAGAPVVAGSAQRLRPALGGL